MFVETYLRECVCDSACKLCVGGCCGFVKWFVDRRSFVCLAAPSDSQGTPPLAPLPLTFAGHELIASVFRSWPMCANLKFIRSAAKAANAAHAYNACWFWRSLLALPARSVRRLLHIGLRIVLGCWFTTECVPDADQPRVSSTRIYQ